MANKSLTDLTARTATADSDLIHVNSGGTDYKQSKSDFIANLDKHITFGTSSSLSSQVDALASGKYFGFILSYGHQSETGMPLDSHFYVEVQKQDGNNIIVTAVSRGTTPRTFQMAKANSWGSWIEMPNRSEITSLNNSLTNLSNQIVSGGGTFGFRYIYGQQNQTTIFGGGAFLRVQRQHILCVYADQNSVRKIFTIFVGDNGALASQTNAVIGSDYYAVSVSGNDIVISTLGNWGNGYAIGLI